MPQLNLGEKITVKGPNGNVVAVVVGVGFDKAELEKLLATGELELVTAPKVDEKPAPVKKPAVKKPESASA